MTKVKHTARKLSTGDYVGSIIVFDGARRIWSKSCGVRRLSRGDALRDAYLLAVEIIKENLGD